MILRDFFFFSKKSMDFAGFQKKERFNSGRPVPARVFRQVLFFPPGLLKEAGEDVPEEPVFRHTTVLLCQRVCRFCVHHHFCSMRDENNPLKASADPSVGECSLAGRVCIPLGFARA